MIRVFFLVFENVVRKNRAIQSAYSLGRRDFERTPPFKSIQLKKPTYESISSCCRKK